MTTSDVAAALGVSTEFIRQEIHAGRLKANATRRTKRWVYRITADQFDEYRTTHWRPFHAKQKAC